jgi:hypothetical protein
MKRERRQPTRSEWERITSRRPVVRKVAKRPLKESTERKESR